MIILQQTRGGLSSGDQLALDLPFAATKSLTARIGPTPTFTRASAATFVGSDGLIQTAATNAPRFDHDPVTPFACKGLLIEESRTNLVFPSAALTTQTRTVTAVAHTLSFYGSGTIVLSGTHSATVVGSGDYPARRTLTFTPTAGSLTLTVTGTVEFAQLEAGSFASSYIPTTTTSAVRSADVCSITGANFTSVWNNSAGTMFSSSARLRPSGFDYAQIFSVTDGTGANRITIGNLGNPNDIEFTVITNNAYLYTGSITNAYVGLARRYALAYSPNSTNRSFNGSIGTDDTSIVVPTVNRIIFGEGQTISAIRYYLRRLSNAKLQALTT